MRRTLLSLVVLLAALVAGAQVRFGLRAGMGLNSLDFSNTSFSDLVSADNRIGFTGGLMLEWETPIIGLALDGAVQYAHRSVDISDGGTYFKRDYLDIPLSLKYKFRIRGIEDKFSPFIFTGPDFAFLVSKKDDGLGSRFSTFSTSWNFGGGVELFRHLQLSAAYGLGLNKSIKEAWVEAVEHGGYEKVVEGTDRFWTISAAWLF